MITVSYTHLDVYKRQATDYLADYLDDVTRTDLRFAGLSADPIRVAALQRALARNTATEASASKLSAEAEIPVPGTATAEVSAQTVRKYIDALTRIFVVEEQPAWAPHLRSKVRLRRQPKWHFVDPSLEMCIRDSTRPVGPGEPSVSTRGRRMG